MDEHKHEWEWTDEYNVGKPAYDYFVIKCKHCPDMRRFHEAIVMLNEYQTLKDATEALSAEDARQFADMVDNEYSVGEPVAQELYDYADILEGK